MSLKKYMAIILTSKCRRILKDFSEADVDEYDETHSSKNYSTAMRKLTASAIGSVLFICFAILFTVICEY